jgi:penicillin-insensitive murein endopeptidase
MSKAQPLIERLSRAFAHLAPAVIVLGLGAASIAGAGAGQGDREPVPPVAATDSRASAEPAKLPEAAASPLPTLVPTVPAAILAAPAVPAAVAPTASEPATAPQAVGGPVLSPAPSPVTATSTAPATPAVPPVAPPAEPDANGGGTPGLKPAKLLFGSAKSPAPLAARAIGSYSRGCLSGARALPVDGPAWQAMRLSRNRNWGHPRLIAMVQRLANDGKAHDGWPGLLVGDISQPRGGPMLTGHASHQIGLDADVWLTPMPDRRLSAAERETLEATSMLADDAVSVSRDKWTDGHLKIIKRAASYPEVERVLVHPAIKQVLCYAADGDRGWLSKVRPYWGHHYHFHIRIGCPPGSNGCVAQAATPGDDGCGKELDDWLRRVANVPSEPAPIPVPPAKPPKEKPPVTLDQLPSECRVVLATGNPDAKADVAAAAAAAAGKSASRAVPVAPLITPSSIAPSSVGPPVVPAQPAGPAKLPAAKIGAPPEDKGKESIAKEASAQKKPGAQ